MTTRELFDRFGTDVVVLIDTRLENHNVGDKMSMLIDVSDIVNITKSILETSEYFLNYIHIDDLNLELDHKPTLTRHELVLLIVSTITHATVTKYDCNTDYNMYKLKFTELKIILINAIYTYINLLTEDELKFEVVKETV